MTNIFRTVGSVLLAILFPMTAAAAAQNEHTASMSARENTLNKQITLNEGDHHIVQYNARTVDPPSGYLSLISDGNKRYAKPRSGYIHPLFGPDGESLTLDWSVDHPHHRGIYWAWPEVQFGDQTGDLHALQHVFSRPVGDPSTTATDTHAQATARNLWLWEDVTPIVFETVIITAHAKTNDGTQAIDLELHFEALDEGVTLARRGTDLYGGLNIRLAPIADLRLHRHADPEGTPTRRAWSYAQGIWAGGSQQVTLALLEHPDNPDYPGDWITYEDLPWFQPAFPKAGTRYPLVQGEPLVLRYRFLIMPGSPDTQSLHEAFDSYVADESKSEETNQDAAQREDKDEC